MNYKQVAASEQKPQSSKKFPVKTTFSQSNLKFEYKKSQRKGTRLFAPLFFGMTKITSLFCLEIGV